jgi:hypothetical protein
MAVQEALAVNEQLSPDRILHTGLAFWPSKTLLSAIEMGVFTELARGPERFDALRSRLGLHPRSARDFLDTLVALGFLSRTGSVTRIPLRPISSSIGASRPTWVESWKWRTVAFIRFGLT